MSADLFLLPPHDNMTPAECLSHCNTDRGDYAEVMVLGIDHGGDLFIRSSAMTRKDALWLLHVALQRVFSPDND